MTLVVAPKRPVIVALPPTRLPAFCRRRGRWAAGRMRRTARRRGGTDAGMITAEYALGTVAACGLAAGLYKVVTSQAFLDAVEGVLNRALHVA